MTNTTRKRILSIALTLMLVLSILPGLAGAASITITRQPEPVKGYKGYTATFSVEAEGEGLEYQWQMRAKQGEDYKDIEGANEAEYTTPELLSSNSHRRFQCIITDADGDSVTSANVNLMVRPAAIQIDTQPRAQRIYEDETAIYGVDAGGPGNLSYQWQRRLQGNNEFEDIPGANSRRLTLSGLTFEDSHTRFRVVVSSDAEGIDDVISASANLLIKEGERKENDERPEEDIEDLEEWEEAPDNPESPNYEGLDPTEEPGETGEPTDEPSTEPTEAPTATPESTATATAKPTAAPEPTATPYYPPYIPPVVTAEPTLKPTEPPTNIPAPQNLRIQGAQ